MVNAKNKSGVAGAVKSKRKSARAAKTPAQARYDAEHCTYGLARRLVGFAAGTGVSKDALPYVAAVYDSVLQHVLSSAMTFAHSDKRSRVTTADVVKATHLMDYPVYGDMHAPYRAFPVTQVLTLRRIHRQTLQQRKEERQQKKEEE
jgi:histone H3/H4